VRYDGCSQDSFILTCFTQKFIGGSFNDSGINVILVFSITALSDVVSVIPAKRVMFCEYSIACIRLFFSPWKGIINEDREHASDRLLKYHVLESMKILLLLIVHGLTQVCSELVF